MTLLQVRILVNISDLAKTHVQITVYCLRAGARHLAALLTYMHSYTSAVSCWLLVGVLDQGPPSNATVYSRLISWNLVHVIYKVEITKYCPC